MGNGVMGAPPPWMGPLIDWRLPNHHSNKTRTAGRNKMANCMLYHKRLILYPFASSSTGEWCRRVNSRTNFWGTRLLAADRHGSQWTDAKTVVQVNVVKATKTNLFLDFETLNGAQNRHLPCSLQLFAQIFALENDLKQFLWMKWMIWIYNLKF